MTRFACLSLTFTAAAAVAILNIAGCPASQTLDTNGNNGTNDTTSTVRAFLPSSITLDVSEIDIDAGSSRLTSQGYGRVLNTATQITDWFHTAADKVLAIGATISDDLTKPTDTTASGTFKINGESVAYKCDFGAFDFDGDGKFDGSGDSQTAPVAFRIWTDSGNGYQQFMCGLITTLPTSTSVGAGKIFAFPAAAASDAPADQQLYIEWDRTSSNHRWNFGYITGTINNDDDSVARIGTARVDVRGSSSYTYEKTVRGAVDFDTHPDSQTSSQNAVHFAQSGGGNALLSVQIVGGNDATTELNTCIDIKTLTENANGCGEFDTQDMNLLDLPIGGEADFPASFGISPSF